MLRDAEEVMGRIRRVPGVEYTVLVPNLRGAERALESRADELNLVMSTSETHNLANLRMPREKSFAALARGDRAWSTAARRSTCRCPPASAARWKGDVPQDEVLRWCRRFADLGVRGLTICDTTGMAHPAQVARMCEALRAALRPPAAAPCTSTTRAAWAWPTCWPRCRRGIDRFDGSLGGLGGCPYAPGASGNISSEDAIHMLEAMGYDTGIDLDRLLQVARALPAIVGHDVPGQVAKAGTTRQLHPVPAAVQELRAAQI